MSLPFFLSLILPQFDCISIMFSIFLLTYTYIEARANYHRGSILILASVLNALLNACRSLPAGC
jgi:Ca2+:H+ antiporter